MKTKSETVSIRMDKEQLKLLDRRREPFGDSRGEQIKRMVIDRLLHAEESRISEDLIRLRAALEELDDRRDQGMNQLNEKLRRLTYLLLSTTGGASSDEAEQVARKVFPPAAGAS